MSGRFVWLLNYVAYVVSVWWSHICALEVIKECGLQVFPTPNRLCGQAVKPMPSWSFKLEREIFDGVKIVAAGHMDVEKIVFDPHREVCCAIVRFDVYGFKPFGDLMIHYFVSEA